MKDNGRDTEGPRGTLRIFSQNVRRNALHVDTILSALVGQYDIVFIQEPPWNTVRLAPSSKSREGEAVIGAPMHPDWMYLARPVQRGEERPRVLSYVSRRLEHLRPSLRLDIVNSPDVVLLELMNGGEEIRLLNVYNSSGCEALEHLERVLDRILAPIEYMGVSGEP